VAARQHPFGIEVRSAAELSDALGDAVGVVLLLVGVREELGLHPLRVDPGRGEIVLAIAQRADDLGRQRLVEELHRELAVDLIAGGDRALFDVLARSPTELFDVSQKRLLGRILLLPVGHDRPPNGDARDGRGRFKPTAAAPTN
jgi:hypothetical protein